MLIAQIPVSFPMGAAINPIEIISCPAVTTFIRLGAANNSNEVANVQSILKNIEQMHVEVTGHFDVNTEDAVKLFQRKYMSEIMAPWGATRSSGIINITTAKKLNHVGCLIPMTLNAGELDAMNRYRANLALTESRPPIMSMMGTDVGAAPAVAVTPVTQLPLTASASNSAEGQSVAAKFGTYFRGLFGK